MPLFEYKVLTYIGASYHPDETLNEVLNKTGKAGWELVSAVPMVLGNGSDGDVDIKVPERKLILKREL